MKKYALDIIIVFVILLLVYGNDETEFQKYNRNNPLNLPVDEVIVHNQGRVFELYDTHREVRNIIVPFAGWQNLKSVTAYEQHPPIYFNLLKDGKNIGQYLLIDQEMHKINDGKCSVAINVASDGQPSMKVLIGMNDGIYIYDPDTESLNRYGNVSDNIIAIDKVFDEDLIYILTDEHKIYKVTNSGTVKTEVEGIKYAKDFVVDRLKAIFFTGEDNKLQVLLDGSTTPHKFEEFNFDAVNPVLSKPIISPIFGKPDKEHGIIYIVDGVPYIAMENQTHIYRGWATVPGLTAYNTEFAYMNIYGVNGVIYQHVVLASNRHNEESASRRLSNRIAEDKDIP